MKSTVGEGAPSRRVPELVLDLVRDATSRDIDHVSVVRETLDSTPIGWIVRLLPPSGGPGAVIFHQVGCPPSAYLHAEPVTVADVHEWVRQCPATSMPVASAAMAQQAVTAVVNGWDVQLDRDHLTRPAREEFKLPEYLKLRASAFDYRHGEGRTAEVSHLVHEPGMGGVDVPQVAACVVSDDRVQQLLAAAAPGTVETLYFDEANETWV